MLVEMKEILSYAKEKKFGVAAPTIWDERSIRMSLEAAVELKSPIILSFVKDYGRNEVFESGIARYLAELAKVPVTIHNDHGAKFEDSIWAIHAGFNCIMADRVDLPYEENVKQTKEIVKIAHSINVAVEGAIGVVAHGIYIGETEKITYTIPLEAKKFVADTGVDILSISVGNLHGTYKEKPEIDYKRVKEIVDIVPSFLTVHGSSGLPYEDMTKLAESGIVKFNMQSYLSKAAMNFQKEYIEKNKDNKSPRALLLKNISEAADNGWKEELKNYIKAIKSDGKA
ncbi:MAG: class II fructose-bisphosphate aldolase [Actinobacteria bacterium]|nr:class II fructose-bisphosphate aldolase [Actinomycetota bacterium]